MALTTTTGSGTQTTTGTPQTVGAASRTATSSNVQPGTAPSLLTNNTQGVSLSNQALTTVSLGAQPRTSTATQSESKPSSASHHINPVALGFCVVLFVAAVGMFIITTRSAKNTT